MSILTDIGTKIGTEIKSTNERVTTLENSGGSGSGVVLQVKIINITSAITFNSDAWIDTGLTLSITPKSATSRFIVSVFGQSAINTTSQGGTGTRLRITKDGNSICETNWQNYLNTIDYSSDMYPSVHLKTNFTTGDLTPFTLKVQGDNYGTDRPWTFNDVNGASSGKENHAELLITEIEN